MGSYYAALEEEGFDAVESLILLSENDIGELCTAINMKRGHKIRFPVIIAKAREEASEEQEIATNERKIAKEEKQRAEKKKKIEQEREEKKEKIAEELADIETERKLAKARSTRVVESEVEEKESFTNPKGFSFTMPPGKNHFAFLSHKKTNSKLAGITETLALRVRSFSFLCFSLFL